MARSWEAEATQCGGDAIINRVALKRIKSLSSRRILWACRTTANLCSVQLSCNPSDLLRPAAHRLGERCRLEQFRIMRRLLREHLNPNAARAFHLAAIRLLSANHHAEQRGLPCAVWTNESDPLASGNADAHVAQNRDGANLAANPSQSQQAHTLVPLRTARRRAAARSADVAPTVAACSPSLQRGPRRSSAPPRIVAAEPDALRPRGRGWQCGQ